MAIAPLGEQFPPVTGFSGTERSGIPPLVPDHTLLRCVGRGSYGEVWLARNIMGTYRAVKVVRRENFEDPRPFDREFQGIQKFEPISRFHEGLVDILQVGRIGGEESFYYVMELADDMVSGQQIDPNSYQPRTLRREANQRGSIPSADCVSLGLALTNALGALHEQGLIHRDVKPSNIIFVNGVPKLADIGLVTGIDATRSYVGTEGFIPPEGPGTPQADLYSLGKVLYEASTGKDRQEFPDLPTAMRDSTEREELLELNEILLRACSNDPTTRYKTAREMRADLALLQSGKSVTRLRRLERRLARARTALAAAGSVAVLATVAVVLFADRARVERESRKRIQEMLNRAEAAEQTARQESYARAMLLAHESVQANNFGLVRELLEQTRAFAMGDGTTNVSRSDGAWEWRHLNFECRDEAAALLARCARSVDSIAVSSDAKWLAAGTGDGGVILWGLPEWQLRQEWQTLRVNVECLSFSPDNRQLASGYIDGSVRVLAIPSGELITELRERSRILDLRFSLDGTSLDYCGEFRHSRYNFTTQSHWHGAPIRMLRAAIAPDLSCLAVGLQPRGLVLYCPSTNTVFQDVTGNRFFDHGYAISPDGRWLAAALADYSIELWSLAEKRPMGRLSGHTAAVRAVAWSADSRLLASGGYDQTVTVWDPGRRTLLRRLRGHQDYVATLAFSPGGRTLYSGSYDRTVRTWTDLEMDPAPSAIALPSGVDHARLAPRAGFASGVTADNIVWTLKTRPAPMTHSRQTGPGGRVGISVDGRWLVAGHVSNDVCEVWRYETNRFLIHSTHNAIGTADTPPAFSLDGGRVALLATNGVLAVWQLDPWCELARWEGVETGAKAIVFDPPGKRVFVRCEDFGVIAADMETGHLSRMPKEGKSAISGMDISPDNRLVAMSSFNGTIVLWACAPGEEPRSLGPVVTERTDAWSVAFSPDGQRLAVGLGDGNIHIWDLKHRMLVGMLKGHRQIVWELGFNPDDDTLVSISPDELRVWRVADGH